MPYAIERFDCEGGNAVYTLGRREAFTVLAFSTTIVRPDLMPQYATVFFDCLDPTGGVIYRQVLGGLQATSAFYSLAPDAEPYVSDSSLEHPTWPQTDGDNNGEWTTMRMAPIALTGGCVVRAYACAGGVFPDQDPFANVDRQYVFTPHLWVEGVGRPRVLPADPPPLLTHVA